jgi:hypothetical protein
MVMLNVTMVSVIKLNVSIMSAMAPLVDGIYKTSCIILKKAPLLNEASSFNLTIILAILCLTTLNIKGMYMTLSISDIQHDNDLPSYRVSLCGVSHFIYANAECHYGECH